MNPSKQIAMELEQARRDFLDEPFIAHWPEGLEQEQIYQLNCDDKGRSGANWLKVYTAGDGDVHLIMQDWEEYPEFQPEFMPSLRCRTYIGGGRNWRTHQALLWLAQAIRLDNIENRRDHV
ncbi:hypothetical protein [Xanthomonas phage BUDD]|nr:hypothetical protein [Xanthomonas phage BUDD]